ncbi:hypothetical protein GYB59_01160 [bacterium]|nr:hypothetical protein [bacterium]
MFRSASALLLLIAALCFSGCGNNSADSKAVAIVDLDRVLKMTGTDLEIQNAVQERQTRIRDDLATFQKRLEDAWNTKKAEFGEEPSEEQQNQLQQFLIRLNQESQQAQSQAQANVSQFRQELYQTFQDQVSPISLEVAKEQGFSIVFGQNPSILAFDTSIDITDAVVERMKQLQQENAAGLGGEAPATGGEDAPALPGAPSITPKLQDPAPTETPLMDTPKLNLPSATETKPTPETPAAKPAEEKMTEEKPAAETDKESSAKPADSEKADAKPEEAKPAETSESKPAEEKPADKKPAEEKPAPEEKPAETSTDEEKSKEEK